MATVVKHRGRWAVAHGITRKPIKRKGRIVSFSSRKRAIVEARRTCKRTMGKRSRCRIDL